MFNSFFLIAPLYFAGEDLPPPPQAVSVPGPKISVTSPILEQKSYPMSYLEANIGATTGYLIHWIIHMTYNFIFTFISTVQFGKQMWL